MLFNLLIVKSIFILSPTIKIPIKYVTNFIHKTTMKLTAS